MCISFQVHIFQNFQVMLRDRKFPSEYQNNLGSLQTRTLHHEPKVQVPFYLPLASMETRHDNREPQILLKINFYSLY